MNGNFDSLKKIVERLNSADLDPSSDVVIAPPTIYLLSVRDLVNPTAGKILVSAQNCYSVDAGAYTGEISAVQLKDCGINWVIIGHSERRTLFGDTDDLVASKTKACHAAGISVICCVGETLKERDAGETIHVVERQLAAVAKAITDWSNVVVAYEPVWAIGTGKVASSAQAQEVHEQIRSWLAKEVSQKAADDTRIIYGGSVTASNCKELARQTDVDGFLVGGASLKPEFVDIVNARKD